MNHWPDKKIFNNVLWDIQQNAMGPESWALTRLVDCHASITQHIDSKDGELALVSARTTDSNWYALTSRRIIGEMNQNAFDVLADRITNCNFGMNPKGHRNVKFAVATITHLDGPPVLIEFETGRAWMAPEYYMSWWIRKYAILDVLKFDQNVETTP